MSLTGELIRSRREELRLSQVAVAKELGFTNAFLNRVERGHCNLPVKHVKKMADILQIKKADLLKVLVGDMEKKIGQRA